MRGETLKFSIPLHNFCPEEQMIVLILYILLIVRSCSICASENSFFNDVTPVNRTDSLIRVKSVQIKHFEFKFDRTAGRRQIGVIGNDAQRWFPESIEIVPQYSLPDKDRTKPPVVLNNFPVIDKNVIFMHGIAALQEMAHLYDTLSSKVERISGKEIGIQTLLGTLRGKLDEEVNNRLLEDKLFIRAEMEKLRKLRELEDLTLLEERSAINLKLEEASKVLKYEEGLVIKRMMHEEKLASEIMIQKIEFEKKLAEQREILRRQSQENVQTKKMEFDQMFELQKIEMEKRAITAELEAKARLERANEDVTLRKMKLQASLDTERTIQIVKSISVQISRILLDIITRPQQLATVFGGLLLILGVYYVIKELFSVCRNFIQARLGRPSLVRETSSEWTIFGLFHSLRSLWSPTSSDTVKEITGKFADVVLSESDKERVVQLVVATRNTKRTGAPFRHILLYGPPGTGKTLIARRLAVCSDMDYAIMSGGDVGPLGDDAVNQLHGLFKWASRSRRGLLLFIDEAEAFLSSRGSLNKGNSSGRAGPSSGDDSHLRHALNALLYQTGIQSTSFSLVLATNRPEDLDSAILDRMDISMHIGLPGLEQRHSLVRQYSGTHVEKIIRLSHNTRKSWFNSKEPYDAEDECFSDQTLSKIASATDGFSGREISKLFIAVQYAMMLAPDKKLSPALLDKIVKTKLEEHAQKLKFYGIADMNRRESTPAGTQRIVSSNK